MKINIDISDDLLAKARKVSIKDENALIEKALQFFVTIETQKKLKDLSIW
jgi:hypothetical protein